MNKHIYALAKNLQSRPDVHSVVGMYSLLMEVRTAILKGRFYIGVRSVSKSGMSRTLTLAYVDKSGVIQEVHPAVYTLAGCDKNRRIKGCNTDMRFDAQYVLFRTLCPKMKYQDKMPRYKRLP